MNKQFGSPLNKEEFASDMASRVGGSPSLHTSEDESLILLDFRINMLNIDTSRRSSSERQLILLKVFF